MLLFKAADLLKIESITVEIGRSAQEELVGTWNRPGSLLV